MRYGNPGFPDEEMSTHKFGNTACGTGSAKQAVFTYRKRTQAL